MGRLSTVRSTKNDGLSRRLTQSQFEARLLEGCPCCGGGLVAFGGPNGGKFFGHLGWQPGEYYLAPGTAGDPNDPPHEPTTINDGVFLDPVRMVMPKGPIVRKHR